MEGKHVPIQRVAAIPASCPCQPVGANWRWCVQDLGLLTGAHASVLNRVEAEAQALDAAIRGGEGLRGAAAAEAAWPGPKLNRVLLPPHAVQREAPAAVAGPSGIPSGHWWFNASCLGARMRPPLVAAAGVAKLGDQLNL